MPLEQSERCAPRIRRLAWHVGAFIWMCFARLRLRVRLTYHGVPGPDQAVLLAGKHASAHDIVLLGVLSFRRTGRRPFFQMGSFIGYRVLGRVKPIMRWVGGFEVMRPKEVRRLAKTPGWDRSAALEHMREVNDRAESVRRAVLTEGGVLAVFPEGTRDSERVRELSSELEVRSALAIAAEGRDVVVWPVSVAMGRPRLLRRPMTVDFLEPFPLRSGTSPGEVLSRIDDSWRERWKPPEMVDDSR